MHSNDCGGSDPSKNIARDCLIHSGLAESRGSAQEGVSWFFFVFLMEATALLCSTAKNPRSTCNCLSYWSRKPNAAPSAAGEPAPPRHLWSLKPTAVGCQLQPPSAAATRSFSVRGNCQTYKVLFITTSNRDERCLTGL